MGAVAVLYNAAFSSCVSFVVFHFCVCGFFYIILGFFPVRTRFSIRYIYQPIRINHLAILGGSQSAAAEFACV